jgi:hypothetical protein
MLSFSISYWDLIKCLYFAWEEGIGGYNFDEISHPKKKEKKEKKTKNSGTDFLIHFGDQFNHWGSMCRWAGSGVRGQALPSSPPPQT